LTSGGGTATLWADERWSGMSETAFEFRGTEETDLRAAYDLFVAAEGEVWDRHRFEWSPPSFEAWSALHRHLLAEDRGRSFVALDEGELIGFSGALSRDDTWFLSALFVLPEYQGGGIGHELLHRSWAGEYRARLTITDSIQPVSTGMYARRGLVPMTPVLSLSGSPKCDPPAGLDAVAPEPEALRSLDRAAYGFDRAADHRFWRERAAEARLWLVAGEPIAYSYVGDQGLIGPLAGRDGEAAALALRAELARRESRQAELQVPGTARRLVETALASSLRVRQPPGLLLLDEHGDPPRALAISGYWLF
jgi:GNAT superfamily N-acetyltransferase